MPSYEPSVTPFASSSPSYQPSHDPSISNMPSVLSSGSPSVSVQPSRSMVTSFQPSRAPSVSTQPSNFPSMNPSMSVQPSTSTVPSRVPSELPSVSSRPSFSSLRPSGSQLPSAQPTESPELAVIGPAQVFDDIDGNGLHGSGEPGLLDVVVHLYCSSNGQEPVLVATDTTDSKGYYVFYDVSPGDCHIFVEAKENSFFSPVVEGGNVVDLTGRGPTEKVKYGDKIRHWKVGVRVPSADTNCETHCDFKPDSCGWGIWNECTCQCVCDPGFCLSANQQCYDGCTTHL